MGVVSDLEKMGAVRVCGDCRKPLTDKEAENYAPRCRECAHEHDRDEALDSIGWFGRSCQ